MWLIIVLCLLVAWIYFKITKSYTYWEDRGVPYLKPFLIFGNMGPNMFRKKAFTCMIDDIYNSYPNERLIKEITVKDFDTFPDHRAFVTGDADPLFGKNLFSLTTERGWHDMRASVSPSFTSSKMKAMFVLMQQCSKQFVDYFKEQGDNITVELKDAFTRYANDVIGTSAFGVTCNSLKDRNNEFYLMGKEASNFTAIRLLKFFGYTACPSFMNLFKIKMISEKANSFFLNLIKQTIKIREEKHIVRPDMVHLLMEVRKGRLNTESSNSVIDSGFAVAQEVETRNTDKKKKVEIDDDDIAAQALIFFLAGFDTSSTLMCYIAYELALNPDIQDKLYYEIDRAIGECNGKITYEVLVGMKYLDNIISETLRKHTPTALTDRNSVKPYTIQPGKPVEKPWYLDKDTLIWIPIRSIHMDPKYYPNPEIFDPDRFNDENKHKIKPFTFLPFGTGPRNCVGSRFALLETKLIIVELLRFFQIVRDKKTEVPVKLSKVNPLPLPDNGIWVGLRSR